MPTPSSSTGATALKPHQPSEGFDHVLVGGTFVVEDGKVTGALPGHVITLATDDR